MREKRGVSSAQQQARVARLQAELSIAQRAHQQTQRLLRERSGLASSQQQARIARLQAQLATARDAAQANASSANPVQPSRQEPVAKPNSSVFMTTTPAQVDDLKRIKGIGPKLEELLNSLGIYQFAQIAQLQAADMCIG